MWDSVSFSLSCSHKLSEKHSWSWNIILSDVLIQQSLRGQVLWAIFMPELNDKIMNMSIKFAFDKKAVLKERGCSSCFIFISTRLKYMMITFIMVGWYMCKTHLNSFYYSFLFPLAAFLHFFVSSSLAEEQSPYFLLFISYFLFKLFAFWIFHIHLINLEKWSSSSHRMTGRAVTKPTMPVLGYKPGAGLWAKENGQQLGGQHHRVKQGGI